MPPSSPTLLACRYPPSTPFPPSPSITIPHLWRSMCDSSGCCVQHEANCTGCFKLRKQYVYEWRPHSWLEYCTLPSASFLLLRLPRVSLHTCSRLVSFSPELLLLLPELRQELLPWGWLMMVYALRGGLNKNNSDIMSIFGREQSI